MTNGASHHGTHLSFGSSQVLICITFAAWLQCFRRLLSRCLLHGISCSQFLSNMSLFNHVHHLSLAQADWLYAFSLSHPKGPDFSDYVEVSMLLICYMPPGVNSDIGCFVFVFS